MSLNIDANFQNVNALNLDAFKAADGAKEFKDLTIAVDDKTFKVSFADNGKVSVRFATTSFFHLFQGSAKDAVRAKIQELVDLHAVTRDLAKPLVITSHSDFVEQTFKQEMGTISAAADGRFAHYGFSDVRAVSAKVLTGITKGQPNAPRHQLINDYNESIGLPGAAHANEMIAFMNELKADLPGTIKPTGGVEAEDAVLWRNYLKGHDLDLFSKIRQARTDAAAGKTTGWAGEIARQGLEGAVLDMVRKNLDPRMLQELPDVNLMLLGIARAVIEATDVDFSGKTAKQIDAAFREIVARHVPHAKETAYQLFDNVLTSALWRQTSKRGLDFFKARGQSVVFDWSKYNGEATDGSELNDKWWKNGSEDVRKHFGAAITNSEMRHLASAKYAQAPGAGRVIRLQGGLTQVDAEAAVAQKIENLKTLEKDDLEALRADLAASFEARKLDDFLPLAQNLVQNVPELGFLGWFPSFGRVSPEAKIAVKAALDRLDARLAATESPLVKTAMLANIGTLFQAELLKDPTIAAEMKPADGNAGAVDPRTEQMRTLAGLDRGRGFAAFFAPDTGRPNALGNLLLDVAAHENLPVGVLVDELAGAFAEKFGCAADEALRHPAFKSFLVRAAGTVHSDMNALLGKLDTVKLAHDAKVAIEAHLAQLPALSPEEQALFARRGDWDLNRLVYNEAVAAKVAGRPVDLAKLQQNAEVIRTICTNALAFTRDVERMLDETFTAAERDRLVDSYLDREPSPVNNYRLSGKATEEKEFAKADADLRERTTAFIDGIGREMGDALPPAVVKSLVIDGVATRAKDVHLAVVKKALDDLRAGGEVSIWNGRGKVARVENFIRAFADRIRTAYTAEYDAHRKAITKFGYDDSNTVMRLLFNAYLVEQPKVAAFLGGSLDAEVLEHLEELSFADETAHDQVLMHVLDIVRAFGKL